MNTTLYQQLSPLGFAEWLDANTDGIIQLSDNLDITDKREIDHWRRTQLNALAFRWLREEKNLLVVIEFAIEIDPELNYYKCFIYALNKDDNNVIEGIYYTEKFALNQHLLAEHEALNKALEILSKGGENG